MPLVAAKMAQSGSKANFFKRIGLNEEERAHRELYEQMRVEAGAGWARIVASRESLLPHLRNDPRIEPPYAFGQISEDVIRAEVIRIFREASWNTSIMYQLGCDSEGDRYENWIIRWLLYHAFRYRDDRNTGSNRRRNPSSENEVEQHSEVPEPIDVEVITDGAAATAAEKAVGTPSNTETAQSSVCKAIAQSMQDMCINPTRTTRFFDPVRDVFL